GHGWGHAPKGRYRQGHRDFGGRKTCLPQTSRQRGGVALMAHPLERIPGRQINIQGKVYAYFGGTAYLGLQSHPPSMDLFYSCVGTFGMHHGSSRKSNVSISVYTQAEEHLADWVGSESCLSMSSGFLAAQLVVQTLIGRGHTLFLAPHAHPALQGSGVVVSASFAELSEKIQGEIDKGGP